MSEPAKCLELRIDGITHYINKEGQEVSKPQEPITWTTGMNMFNDACKWYDEHYKN